jgi:hypothetical protein
MFALGFYTLCLFAMVEDEVFIVESVGGVDEKTINTNMNLVGSSSNVENVHS